MTDTSGRCAITYNGEIYNYRRLRDGLLAEGREFRTTSDTEVLLELYLTHGEAMVERLRGMFAFALWDERRGALWLARDAYGIKPLYYADDGRCIRVASQVKALVAGGNVSPAVDSRSACAFLMLGSIPEPYTIAQGTLALPAGGSLWIDERGACEPRVWLRVADLMRASESAPADDIECARALGESAVAHLEADVPVGLFLSSGIDSTALLGLIRSKQPDLQLRTITLGFEEFNGTAHDETPWARRIASRYASTHCEDYLSHREFESDVPALLDAMDQPSIDGANTWFVSKVAARAGLKVALSGIGGDELFGGYPSFAQLPRLIHGLAAPSRLPLLGAAFEGLHRTVSTMLPFGSPKLAGVLRYARSMEAAYFLRRAVFMPWELPDLVDREVAADACRRFDPVAYAQEAIGGAFSGRPFAHVAALESSVYLRNQLLRDADWAGMAHSLEIRPPWVDVFLLRRLAGRLVSGPRLDKRLLADAPQPQLPAALRDRPKSGFVLPMQRWLASSGQLDDWRRIPRLRRRNCNWARRWAYTVLCRTLPTWEGLRRAA